MKTPTQGHLAMETSKESIERICEATRVLLVNKNRDYGNSALTPIGIFGTGDAVINLGARMDDKLGRLKKLGIGTQTIDTLYDLNGYIVLLIIALERAEGVRSEEFIHEGDSNTTESLSNE